MRSQSQGVRGLSAAAGGMIAVSGGFAVTPKTRSWPNFAGRRQSQSIEIRRKNRLLGPLAHDWVRFVIRRIGRRFRPFKDNCNKGKIHNYGNIRSPVFQFRSLRNRGARGGLKRLRVARFFPRKRGFSTCENMLQDQRLDVGGGDGIAAHEVGLAGDEEGSLGGIVGDAAVGAAHQGRVERHHVH